MQGDPAIFHFDFFVCIKYLDFDVILLLQGDAAIFQPVSHRVRGNSLFFVQYNSTKHPMHHMIIWNTIQQSILCAIYFYVLPSFVNHPMLDQMI